MLWRSELRNVLVLYLRQRRLELSDALAIMEVAEGVLRDHEYAIPSLAVLELASTSGCSAYDCEFVALAHELNLPLVTLDGKVLTAFPDVAVALEKFAA